MKFKRFALNIADQISKITVKPFCEISFHSLEFRDKTILKKHIDKIPKGNNPLIYVLQVKSSKKLKIIIECFENYHSANKLKTKNKEREIERESDKKKKVQKG